MKIQSLIGREILDSRGNPTIEVKCILENGIFGIASIPSGASTGIHEAVELRDGDKKRYNGLGVLNAIKNLEIEILENVKGKDFDQKSLDQFLINLDGTKNKSRLGANAILGVSLSFAEAMAKNKDQQIFEYIGELVGNKNFKIPQPMFNIINGGKHADSGLDIQEFMIVPIAFPNVKEKIRVASEITFALKGLLHKDGFVVSVGDEGGFAPKLPKNESALDYIVQAIIEAGYDTEKVKIAMDVAASSFFGNEKYNLKIDGIEKNINSEEIINWYENLIEKYPIISIEDGLAEDDWTGFQNLQNKLGNKILSVGDDLTVTNIERIKIAKEKNAINAVLIKVNQIGTLTETLGAIMETQKNGWTPIISHRSGETSSTFISDLAVGTSSSNMKSGAPVRGERVCKYNRLMEIEDLL
jgi:enolase